MVLGSASQGGRCRKFDGAYTTLPLGWCPDIGQPLDTAPGVGNHSLRCGTAGGGSGVPGPETRLGPTSSQALGHPGAAKSHKRAKNGVGDLRLDLGRDQVGKEGKLWLVHVRFLGLMVAAGLGLAWAWWWPWLETQRSLLCSVGKGCGSP